MNNTMHMMPRPRGSCNCVVGGSVNPRPGGHGPSKMCSMSAERSLTFGELHAFGPAAVAERLGFSILRGRTISPCPACMAKYRSSGGHDKRGPIGLTPDGL